MTDTNPFLTVQINLYESDRVVTQRRPNLTPSKLGTFLLLGIRFVAKL